MKLSDLNDGGFSLIEMLVALAVMAATLAIAGAAWQDRTRSQTSLELARSIAQLAKQSRAEARISGNSAALIFDLEKRQFSLSSGGKEISFGDQFQVSASTGRQLLTSANSGSIEFFPSGSSTGGRVVIKRKDGDTAYVRINWLTAAVITGRSHE